MAYTNKLYGFRDMDTNKVYFFDKKIDRDTTLTEGQYNNIFWNTYTFIEYGAEGDKHYTLGQ